MPAEGTAGEGLTQESIAPEPSVEAFASYFPPSKIKHGLFVRLEETHHGIKKVCVTEDGDPATFELIAKHLRLNRQPAGHWRALGYLSSVVSSDGEASTNVGMIDLDGKSYEGLEPDAMEQDRLRLQDVAEAHGFHVYFERSSRGNGWHVYIFTTLFLLLGLMARILRGWAQAAMVHNAAAVETYPANGNATGKWTILPYASAGKDERRLGDTYLETEDGIPIPFDELDEWIIRTPSELLAPLAVAETPQPTEE